MLVLVGFEVSYNAHVYGFNCMNDDVRKLCGFLYKVGQGVADLEHLSCFVLTISLGTAQIFVVLDIEIISNTFQ